jgi:hypothetical protein
MHFVLLTLLSALCLQAASALSPLKAVETHTEHIEGRYIVTLHRQSSKEAYLGWLTGRLDNDSSILHSQWDSKFFNGFGAKLSKESLRLIQAHPDVASISEDGLVRAYSTQVSHYSVVSCKRDLIIIRPTLPGAYSASANVLNYRDRIQAPWITRIRMVERRQALTFT